MTYDVYKELRDQGLLNERTEQAFKIVDEYMRARQKFPPFRSAHEGYAIILEEVDEMWAEIKANNTKLARKECVQVAAMCFAFLLEVGHDDP